MQKKLSKLIIVLFLSLILFDFIACQMKWSFGPNLWRRQWFMFSYSDNKLSKLVLIGKLQNGEKVPIPMERWFSYFVGFETARYNEISRRNDQLEKLAAYACREYNQSVGPKSKIVSISVMSAVWDKQSGHRLRLKDIPTKQLRLYPHLIKNCI